MNVEMKENTTNKNEKKPNGMVWATQENYTEKKERNNK